jgi:hypothetical protein
MSKPHRELSQKQVRAISALITAPTIADAAWQADVSTRTIDRWLTQRSFQAELRLARSRVFCHAFGHLQQVASRAVAALDRVMHDNNASPASRVSAARAALRFACHGIEIADFEERLAALEHPGAGNGEDQDEAGQESDQELEEEEAREREQELADWANGKPSTNPPTHEGCHEEPGKKGSGQKDPEEGEA